MRTLKTTALLAVPLAAAALTLTSCSQADTATPSSMCGFVVGTGDSGHDAKLHKILWPNQTFDLNDHEDVQYVPCNSRNFIINDGTEEGVSGKIGDKFTPTKAYTSDGTAIAVWSRADFTLNENTDAMTNFYTVCLKHECASDHPSAGTANNSTDGWNDLLDEDFLPAQEDVAVIAAHQVSDRVWRQHDPRDRAKMADIMSKLFKNSVRQKTGYSTDLFCGSGNSQWADPNKPGDGQFTCSNVRIEVSRVEKWVDTGQGTGSSVGSGDSSTASLNRSTVRNAEILYGRKYAQYWLGLQDTIDKCSSANVTCVVTIGGAGAPAISIPSGK